MKRFLLLLVALVVRPAFADPVPCTDNPTASVSHFVTHNTEYGGHVTQHILGQTPPPGESQSGKTMFAGTDDYDAAWEALRVEDPPLYCSAHPVLGAFAARSLVMPLTAKRCDHAGNDGKCDRSVDVHTGYVRLIFQAIELHRGQSPKWILYTAYPSYFAAVVHSPKRHRPHKESPRD